MRFSRLVTLALAASTVMLASPPVAEAQFNPFGRKKPKPAARPSERPRPPRARPPARHGKKPTMKALIARYTRIVLQRPGAQFPLQRLTQLYRDRDGELGKLVREFEGRAERGDWNALVALAGIYRYDGQQDRAIATYEKAIAERSDSSVALTALAHLLNDRGDKRGAKQRFEQALPHIKVDAEREQILRTLMALCLDLKEWDSASSYHKKLVKRAKGSFFVRAELGRELLSRGEYARAEVEYRGVVKAARGDNRVLAPALRDLGRAQAKLKKGAEALKTLERALRVAGRQAGVRREIYEIIVEVYRADDNLRELIATIEKEGARDFERLRMLGALYEEVGRVDDALSAYRKALTKRSKDIGTRLKVVQLLQIQGDLDEAIREYEALIRAAPRNPDYVFQLAEALIQRGDRPRALEHLKKLEARSRNDEETLAALVDFYERVEEKDRAMAVLQRLAKGRVRDPRHLVELGDRYFQEGNKKKAREVWERIKVIVPNRARAQHTLGEVYLEHDMPTEALSAFREATKAAPTKRKYRKALALALERTGASASSTAARRKQYGEARRIWEQLLHDAGGDGHLAREARTHIVTLWSLGGRLAARVLPLGRRFNNEPPDLEAGRLLAEVHIRLRRYPDAERTLRRVVESSPGDAASYLRLERVLVLQRKLREAIRTLRKLARVDPKRTREYYQRMAQYAAELYQDDEAIRYAARAVELSPDDANGHRKLGEMYRRRQDIDKAIAQFRQAITKNDRLFSTYFQLAELLISRGKVDEADKLLRRVVRASPDDELVAQAARLSMQVNLGRGTLESLEKDLLPVALGSPQKPLYRQLLVEIYGALAFPLVHQARSPDPDEAAAALAALRRIGERAVKPLLDALGDERTAQQRIAIELLAHIHNKSAGSALFAYANGSAETDLRVRAMIAVGRLEDPAMLPKLEGLLAPGGEARPDESDPVSVAAAWGVARMRSRKARGLLVKMTAGGAPRIRALGALGLGLLGDRRDAKLLARIAESFEAGPLARAAAAFALGELGATTQFEPLTQLAEATNPTLRAAAVLALARLRSEMARRAIAEALVSPDETLQVAGKAAALVFTTGRYRRSGDPLAVRGGRVDVAALLDRLRPTGYDAEARARALVTLAPDIARAAVADVQSSPSRARAISNALVAGGDGPGFGPLIPDLASVAPESRAAAANAIETIARAVVPPFIALSRHPSAEVRARAVQFLATRREPSALAAVIDALSDRDESVQQSVLTAIARSRGAGAVGAITKLLAGASTWPVRVRAAEALGRLAAGSKDARVVAVLSDVARRDSYALVREAAVRAIASVDASAGRDVLRQVARRDPEPRVRRVAEKLLRGGK